MLKGIAGSQHADRAAPVAQQLRKVRIERTRPTVGSATNEGLRQCEMSGASKHEFGRLDQSSRGGVQALHAVLTDAHDGQPAPEWGSLSGYGTI